MFAVPSYATTVYKWVDEKGVINFTDDYKKVPHAFRNRVKTEKYLEEKPSSILPQRMTAKIEEQVETGSYDRDYRSKQLDEATLNYEKAREELLKEGERLVWHRYGSKTQYQMFTAELPGISQRLESYREQIIKAKAMLDEVTGETQEEDAVSSSKNEGTQTDFYGRDGTWWKERVRPWKEQLEGATQSYEKACESFLKRVEGLGPFRWGGLSLTQYQMISSVLTELSGQMAEYEAQILEARGMLSRLSKEARETGADPAWLE